MGRHKMEIWKKWPEKFLDLIVADIQILHDIQFLKIIFKQPGKDVIMQYDRGWFSSRATACEAFEKMELLKKQKNTKIPDNTYLFKIENSDYLQWLHKESCGIYENSTHKMEHFVFIGSNFVFEVLAINDPEIKIIPR